MYRVTFLIDNSDYSKYKDHALNCFNDFVSSNKLKDKKYLNGSRKVWFTKSAFKYGSYLIDNLRFESVPLEVDKLK